MPKPQRTPEEERAYTIVRVTFMLPDGSEAMTQAVQVPANMRDLSNARYRIEMWPDKPPAVEMTT